MAKLEIKIPDIGDYQGVPVIEVLVKDGDTVKAEQPLLVLETDKATMEIPSTGAGVVEGLQLKAGDKVSMGDVICSLQGADAATSKSAAPAPGAATPLPPGEGPGVRASEAQAGSGSQTPSPAPAGHPLPAGEGKAAAAASTLAVTIPDIGDFSGVPVIEVLVKDGDIVKAEQPLLVLETDKATMEIPSPGAGVVQGLKLKAGDKVSKGDAVCSLQGAAASTPLRPGEGPGVRASEAQASSKSQPPSPAPAGHPLPAGEGKAAAQPVAETPQQSSGKPGELPYAGPATRKFARELGVDLSLVKGSGLRGRIVIEDVQGYVKQTLAQPPAVSSAAPAGGSGIPPIPAVDFSQFGEIETVPLARIRKLSAAHLHRAWVNIPHVTQTDDADITDLEAFRKSASDESGTKLTLLPFVMKAVEKAMQAYPDFNSSLSPDGASLIRKKYLHIGFAADTPNGLVVPVVRDVDQKGIVQLANECAELAKKARDGKLKPDEMKGGCFSISSLGGIGGGYFTPIVNAPEVAILGVSRGVMKPVWDGKAFQPRLMLPLSLSYDHRVIDGALGARFIVMLTKLLGDLRRLTL